MTADTEPTCIVVDDIDEPCFICLRCEARPSYHPQDIQHLFCSACGFDHREALRTSYAPEAILIAADLIRRHKRS